MQAQDYLGALWSIGLRLPDSTEAAIEKAVEERSIVRTWPMRGTLHFVAAVEVRWMLELLTPRSIAGQAARARELELDAIVFSKCEKLFINALKGDRQLTREAMMNLLEAHHISTIKQRGYHILWRLAQEGLLIFAARSGKSHTFALLEEWVPPAKKLDREAALLELTRRYFTSHGPAMLSDFAGWSGLKITDARAGLEAASSHLHKEKVGDADFWMSAETVMPADEAKATYLLPGFDEYLLGYKDRRAVLETQHAEKIVPGGNGMFLSTIVMNGRVVGTWKRVLKKKSVAITATGFKPFNNAEKQSIIEAAERYGQFLGLPVEVTPPPV